MRLSLQIYEWITVSKYMWMIINPTWAGKIHTNYKTNYIQNTIQITC